MIIALIVTNDSPMSNEYYDHDAYPSTGSPTTSSDMRDELDKIERGFDKLPLLKDAGGCPVFVRDDESGLETRAPFSFSGEAVEITYKQYMMAGELDPRTVYFIPDWQNGSQAVAFNDVIYRVLNLDPSDKNALELNEDGQLLFDKTAFDSPNMIGTPTAPTAAPGTETDQLATTKFVTLSVTLVKAEIDKVSTPIPQGAVTSTINGKALQTTPQIPDGDKKLHDLLGVLSKFCHWHNSINAPSTHCSYCSYCSAQTHCSYCTHCTSFCTYCEYCSQCALCSDCSNCSQCSCDNYQCSCNGCDGCGDGGGGDSSGCDSCDSGNGGDGCDSGGY